jgi:uncharacterized cupredoxin-like copper-binding protein
MKPLAVSLLLAVALAATACGSDSGAGNGVEVVATDSKCTPAKTDFAAGKVTFVVKNQGKKVTELYIYGQNDRIVGEVENIGPGTSRKLTADLKAGDYELACKPGQTGDGIRAKIAVTGAGGSQGGAQAPASREVRVGAVDFMFSGMDGFAAKAGDTVHFYLDNKGTVKHEFEVLGPDGKSVGEVEPTEAGRTGEATITLARAGNYTYVCGIEDHEAKGMKGSFNVTA